MKSQMKNQQQILNKSLTLVDLKRFRGNFETLFPSSCKYFRPLSPLKACPCTDSISLWLKSRLTRLVNRLTSRDVKLVKKFPDKSKRVKTCSESKMVSGNCDKVLFANIKVSRLLRLAKTFLWKLFNWLFDISIFLRLSVVSKADFSTVLKQLLAKLRSSI